MKKNKPGSPPLSPPVDESRRRLLFGIAATGTGALVPGVSPAQVCEQIRTEERRLDRKCVVRKGTLAQPERIWDCKWSVEHNEGPEPCTKIIEP